jgi:voltage-gated potassium channel
MSPDPKTSPVGLKRVMKGFIILLVILTIGTSGYMLIEKWSFLDSLYMTAIAITAVGYREIGPPSSAGKVFTIPIAFGGTGNVDRRRYQ